MIAATLAVVCPAFGQDMQTQADSVAMKFRDRLYAQCSTPGSNGPDPVFIGGALELPVILCPARDDCRTIVKVARGQGVAMFRARSDADSRTPAQRANQVEWVGGIYSDYNLIKHRQIADGNAGQWTDEWEDVASPVRLAGIEKKQGQWLINGMSVSNFLASAGAQPACAWDAAKYIAPPSAIPQPALPAGFDQAVSKLTRHHYQVCYSITPPQANTAGECQPTGETVQSADDLMMPDSFWKRYPTNCRSVGYAGVEVTLRNPVPNDGKKRFLNCIEVGYLAAQRNGYVRPRRSNHQ
jgi:hypothetical protein